MLSSRWGITPWQVILVFTFALWSSSPTFYERNFQQFTFSKESEHKSKEQADNNNFIWKKLLVKCWRYVHLDVNNVNVFRIFSGRSQLFALWTSSWHGLVSDATFLEKQTKPRFSFFKQILLKILNSFENDLHSLLKTIILIITPHRRWKKTIQIWLVSAMG